MFTLRSENMFKKKKKIEMIKIKIKIFPKQRITFIPELLQEFANGLYKARYGSFSSNLLSSIFKTL